MGGFKCTIKGINVKTTIFKHISNNLLQLGQYPVTKS